MKKQIIVGIAVVACDAMCAAVWPRSAEVGDLPAEPVKTAVNAETEARPEKIQEILLSGDNPAPEVEVIAESEPPKTEITAEEKTESARQQNRHLALYQNQHQPPTNPSRGQ